jgi:hypothetical protein
MSDKRKQAQQERRSREREMAAESAAAAAESAAEASTDPVGSESDAPEDAMPTVDHSARMAQLEALRNKPEDMDQYIREESEDTPAEQPVAENPAPKAPTLEPTATSEPEMVTVKIDGEEQSVTKADVDALGGVAAYQIHKAAEKRLAQANHEKQEMAKLLEQARVMFESAKPKEPVKPPEELLKEKVQQIQFGTPEEAAQALQEILASNTKQVDANQVAAQVMTQIQQNTAAQQFAQRNQDILQNPVLVKLALVLERDKLNKSPPSDWNRFYSDLEAEFRNAIGKPVTTQTPSSSTPQSGQPTSGLDAKLSRKDNIVNLPTAAARVAAPEPDKPLSREDRLNQLRTARGQPVG